MASKCAVWYFFEVLDRSMLYRLEVFSIRAGHLGANTTRPMPAIDLSTRPEVRKATRGEGKGKGRHCSIDQTGQREFVGGEGTGERKGGGIARARRGRKMTRIGAGEGWWGETL